MPFHDKEARLPWTTREKPDGMLPQKRAHNDKRETRTNITYGQSQPDQHTENTQQKIRLNILCDGKLNTNAATMHPDMRGSLIFAFPGVAHFLQLAKPLIFVLRQGKASQAARQGKAIASQGKSNARQGKSRRGNATQCKVRRPQGKPRRRRARQRRQGDSKARQGKVRQCKVTQRKATARQGLLLFFFPIGILTQPRPPPEMKHGPPRGEKLK